MELSESRSEDVIEIAKEKAAFAYEQLKQPVIVIDGAFHIKALNDFPKTMVKFTERYLGAKGILKLLEGRPIEPMNGRMHFATKMARLKSASLGIFAERLPIPFQPAIRAMILALFKYQ